MRILVTGGAGFIGSHSVERLLADGHSVHVLDNLASGHASNLPAGHARLTLQIGDVRDAPAVTAAMAGVDAVLHLAAQVFVPRSIAEPVESAAVNIHGYLQVLDAARRAGVRRVVHASSAAVYGVPATLPVTEQTPTAPMSPYGLEKLVNDQHAALFADLYGMATCGLRYFNVYGPRQDPRSTYSGVVSRFVEGIRTEQPLTVFGDGLQSRDFISVFDVARANAAALAADVTGVINVATGRSVTLLDLLEALGDLLGTAPTWRHEPARAGDIRHSAVAPQRLISDLGIDGCLELRQGLRRLVDSLPADGAAIAAIARGPGRDRAAAPA